jgi:ankyrin repeat protein
MTAVMLAVELQRWQVLSSLVQGLESLNLETSNGDTALISAARQANIQGVQKLVKEVRRLGEIWGFRV